MNLTIAAARTARNSLAKQVAQATRVVSSPIKTIKGRKALTTMQAARYLGTVDAVTLVRWQQTKEPTMPPFYVYHGEVLYLEDDLTAWRSRRD